jgi:hypothetical protein
MILNEWYEIVEGDQLMQGDIVEDCPVFLPPIDMQWPINTEDPQTFDSGFENVIIMSQSCDLDKQDKDLLVLLCPVWSISDTANFNPFLNSDFGKEECRRGNMPGYHMINKCDHERWQQEISIVSFRDVWSLPMDFVQKVARGKGQRPRLRPPYREHLAQSFARFFMRVGLPVEIPAFTSDRAEKEVMKKLSVMEPEKRNKIFKSFQ